MQVQTNTDRNIEGSVRLSLKVTTVVERALQRFSGRVSRVEVHLSDENSGKGGADDKRCVMEARLEGRPPAAVTHKAATLDQALDGAAVKLARSIGSTLARLRDY